MQFRWQALESRRDGDLGVYTGAIEGEWGVTTLKVNPVTNDPYVRMFETEAEAVRYARDRAYKAGPLYERGPRQEGEAPRRAARSNIYYVVRMPRHQYDDEGRRLLLPVHRVLRGERGGVRGTGGYVERQEAVLVFDYKGSFQTQSGEQRDRWKLNKGLTVNVIDIEEQRELRTRGPHRR